MKFLTLAPIDANYTFRTMLQTLSRPGTIEALTLSTDSQCIPETALMLAVNRRESLGSLVEFGIGRATNRVTQSRMGVVIRRTFN